MHIVYMIIFHDKLLNNQYPCFYIGSKSNCTFHNNIIYSKEMNEYWGSSKDKEFLSLVNSDTSKKAYILYNSDIYEDVLKMEREIHIQNDVIGDIKYFNKSIATVNNYHMPNYGSYRHMISGKMVRLPKNHPRVLSGEFINSNKGYKTYNNGIIEKQFLTPPVSTEWNKGRLKKHYLYKEQNPFYGKKHNKETKKNISDKTFDFFKTEKGIEQRKQLSINATLRFKGKKRKKESIEGTARAHKNKISLKNIHTGISIRIDKQFSHEYDSSIWIHPYAYKMKYTIKEIIQCPYCKKTNENNASFKKWHFDNCKEKK